MKLPLSLVIIAKNEEAHIAACIQSAHFVSEVIVVIDDQTNDRTQEISEKLGAKVFVKKWLGFGPQKKWAVEQAQYDWVLCLDADERISESLCEEILERFQQLDPETLYYFPRVSYYLGKWIWHGGWFPDFQGRLFHRKYFNWNEATIHERVVGGGKIQHFLEPMEHYVFESFKDHQETNFRYAQLLADQDDLKQRFYHHFLLLVRPWWKFFECYILKQGFRDGWPGFIIAVSAAYSIFMRLVFRYEKRIPKS